MVQKPILLILGTYHMDNPGRDMKNFQADNVLVPKRQREIEQLVSRLQTFRPTKIAVEVDPQDEAKLNEKYRRYREGRLHLGRNEVEQIGFRLAKALGHPRLYAVDWRRDISVDPSILDFPSFAKAHGQKPLLDELDAKGAHHIARLEAIQRRGTIIDLLYHLNLPKVCREDHRAYFTIARIGRGDQYPGAEWVQYWYGRNLKIFVNLTRITESNEDRILLIIGAGHVWLLQQFAKESGFFAVESPLRYLRSLKGA